MADFSHPVDERFFEDCLPGTDLAYGPGQVTEEAALGSARAFDPQVMHADQAGAAEGPFGALIASGRHTALMMGIFATSFLNDSASPASPGIDELRWVRPVRPGDVLSARTADSAFSDTVKTAGGGVCSTTFSMTMSASFPVPTV